MFQGDLKRGDAEWSPFAIRKKTVEAAPMESDDGAVEIKPIIVVSAHDRAVVQQVGPPEKEEVEPVADVDPKDSSATSSASDSEVDSDENGNSQTQTPNPAHPSSLPLEPGDPVSVVKAPSLTLGVLTPLTSPGSD